MIVIIIVGVIIKIVSLIYVFGVVFNRDFG